MKIYFIGQKGIPATSGGVERHVEELATRLAQEGHEVFVYCRNYFTPKSLKEYQGVKLIHLPSIKTKHLDAITHTFLASLDVLRRDADIIHYHAIGPSSLLWIPKLLKKSAKVISTFHSDDRKHKKWGAFAQKCLGLGAYVSVKMPDRSIAVSQHQALVNGQEFHGEQEYIPNGVPAPVFAKPNIITQRWGLEGNDYILAVSRLVRHKGLHYLIRAYSILKDPAKKLVIAGDANFTEDYVKYLKELAGDNKNIIFTGNQTGTALAELYSNAYFFVQPSEAEGLSISLLEAMSYSKAVLASDIAPNREAMADLGLTFNSRSINDLAQKMQYLLNHPEIVREMGDKLQYRAETVYNWEAIVKKTVDVYKSSLVKPTMLGNLETKKI